MVAAWGHVGFLCCYSGNVLDGGPGLSGSESVWFGQFGLVLGLQWFGLWRGGGWSAMHQGISGLVWCVGLPVVWFVGPAVVLCWVVGASRVPCAETSSCPAAGFHWPSRGLVGARPGGCTLHWCRSVVCCQCSLPQHEHMHLPGSVSTHKSI